MSHDFFSSRNSNFIRLSLAPQAKEEEPEPLLNLLPYTIMRGEGSIFSGKQGHEMRKERGVYSCIVPRKGGRRKRETSLGGRKGSDA
ncbi:Uncharacterized protein TCM_041762 [Theobroma cacao]|uniref:Uncharacterized protein n=1 Tax=Theobroma cacao TaxID=3641 RepID=A0A061GXK0_THECC|nr:Uncharacterized protein TCM_041762 [Theobroma cacao]